MENDRNLDWFLEILCRIIEQYITTFLGELTFLSHRQEGLFDGVHNNFPDSPHGYYLKHLADKFYKNFPIKKLKSLLWKAASAIDFDRWNNAINVMNIIEPLALSWLETNAHPQHWAEMFFMGQRFGHLTSNISESVRCWLQVSLSGDSVARI